MKKKKIKSDQQRVDRVIKQIYDGIKTAETYNSGLAQEKLIVASYKTMSIQQLEALRYILNKIIKQKKLIKVIKENERNKKANTENETKVKG